MPTISSFLLDRLSQLEVKSIFGVPGDFNLGFLDFVEDKKDINWVGCCNELNASYAADGYARVNQGLGVLITTFGVGELSAINGIAGAMAERVPVLHIVGMPSTKLQGNKALLHHTLGDGQFSAFARMSAHVTVDELVLDRINAKDAAQKIDELLKMSITRSQPVYLGLPTDLVEEEIDLTGVEKSLSKRGIISTQIERPLKQTMVDNVLGHITEMWKKAERPCVLVDACAVRFSMQDLTKHLIEETGMAFFTTPMAKTTIGEDHPQFSGCYIGSISLPDVSKHIESSDLVFSIGALKSDFNTGSFSYKIPEEQTIELHSDHLKVAFARYPDLNFYTFFPKLIQALTSTKPKGLLKPLSQTYPEVKINMEADHLEQDTFWPQVTKFIKPEHITIAETGTSSFGILDSKLLSTHQSQVLYGSIGWATGNALGCSVAGAETDRRCVLFTGEGSAQVTIQDISQFMRLGLKPTLFILNNRGYTIERAIHGPERLYNDVPAWDWQNALSFFGAAKGESESYRVSTPKELEDLIQNPEFLRSDKIQLVEVMLQASDSPRALRLQTALTAKANAE